MAKSKKHLLEWITSEEAERTAKTDVFSYYKNMSANTLFGILGIAVAILVQSLNVGIANFALIIGLYWLLTPALMCKISKANKEVKAVEKIDESEKNTCKKLHIEHGYILRKT